MEKKLFTIGEISDMKGITKKALRFYDRIDLLKPSYVNPDNGYRYYSTEQFVYIDIIHALREIDLSPLEIRSILARKNTSDLLKFLKLQKARIQKKIEVLQRMNSTIQNVGISIGDALASVKNNNCYVKHLEKRHYISLPYNNLHTDEAAIIEFSKFDKLLERYKLINAFQTGILFEQGSQVSVPSVIFNTVEIQNTSDTSVVKTLAAGDYVCVCYSAANANSQLQKINEYCHEHTVLSSVIVQVELLNDVFALEAPVVELQILLASD